jgi:hypothetical protein
MKCGALARAKAYKRRPGSSAKKRADRWQRFSRGANSGRLRLVKGLAHRAHLVIRLAPAMALMSLAACGGSSVSVSTGSNGSSSSSSNSGGFGGPPSFPSDDCTGNRIVSSGNGSSSSVGSAATWIPIQATPILYTTGGQNGVFVIPSNALTTPPVEISGPSYPQELGLGVASSSTGYAVGSALYFGTGSDGYAHFYSLNLTDTGVAPSAVQSTALTLPAPVVNPPTSCLVFFHTSQADLHDPTSLFALVQLPTARVNGSCGTGEPVYDLISYGAAATAQPVLTPIPPACSGMDSVYTDQGTLGGLLVADADKDLLFYAYNGSNFTRNANPIATNLGYFVLNFASNSTGTEVFASGQDTSYAYHVYGVNASGTTLFEYTAQGSVGSRFTDANNLYFTDGGATQISQGANTYLYAVPLEKAVSSPTLLATLPNSVYGSVSLVGSASGGTALLFLGTLGTGSSQNSTLYSVSVPGGVISTVTAYGSVSNLTLFLDSTGTYLYEDNFDSHASTVSTVNGQVLQSTPNSYFLPGTLLFTSTGNVGGTLGVSAQAALRASNLTKDSGGNYDPGSFDVLNTPSLMTGTIIDPTLVQGPMGAPYIPSIGPGLPGALGGFPFRYDRMSGTYIASGELGNGAIVFDLSLHYMIPVVIGGATTANTSVNIWD